MNSKSRVGSGVISGSSMRERHCEKKTLCVYKKLSLFVCLLIYNMYL